MHKNRLAKHERENTQKADYLSFVVSELKNRKRGKISFLKKKIYIYVFERR